MSDAVNIEKSIKDFLNIGIGLFRVGEENLQASLKSIVSNFEELKQKGSGDSTQSIEKIRELLDNTLESMQKLSKQAQSNVEKLTSETQKGYEKVLGQIRSTLGEEQYEKVATKIQGFYDIAKDRVSDIQKNTTDIVDSIKANASKIISSK